MKKALKYLAVGFLLVLILIQFIPVDLPENNSDHSKDMVRTENAPDEVKFILSKACYDCHSNQTVYPWYSKVAPVSWLVAKDTREGRDELNFSEWAELSKRKKIKILNELAEEVEDKKMPLKIYTVVHRDAILTDEEISTLMSWTKSQSDKIMGGD
ncbi:MAG: heme-binding domain-containing protein [Cyclobacteriaceae bacterium]|nr:heme-binding domain-containing protein [Cyclobacteriaceae bacterium]